MSSIMNKLKKNSKIEDADDLTTSKFFTEKEMVPTDVPMINVALSGSLTGGLMPGHTVIAGESKHFKTAFSLLMAASYLKSKPDAALIFYDTEFGTPQSYFDTFGIDTDRVLHVPVTNIEQLKFDLISQVENLDRGDDVVIVIDSIGNVASKKELDDALEGKSAADMSRAKALKSLFRMVTPYLSLKNIPLITINHVYEGMALYAKKTVSGGTGVYYSADNVWIVGRRQNKDAGEVKGYDFIINIDKSRYLKEGTKIPISVSHSSGIEKYSGLLDVALAGGFVSKPSNGWYQLVDLETGELVGCKVRQKDTLNAEFWSDILTSDKFQDFIRNSYQFGGLIDLDLDLEEAV